jgi:probable addiction module antidote protein
MEKITHFDPADYLNSPEDLSAYLDAVIDENDPELLVAALGDISRARGMSKLAKDTGLARESLYRSLSASGNPSFTTVVKVLNSMGLRLHVIAQ